MADTLFTDIKWRLGCFLENTLAHNLDTIIEAYNNMQESENDSQIKVLCVKKNEDLKILANFNVSFTDLENAFKNREFFFILVKDYTNNTFVLKPILCTNLKELLLNSIHNTNLPQHILLSNEENASRYLASKFFICLANE